MRNKDPYQLTARFDSICPETGKPIRKGDQCIYYPAMRKAYHLKSKAAEEYRSNQFSRAWCMADANW